MKAVSFAILGVAAFATPAFAFERGTQAQYDLFAYCYGQHVGSANALADDHENWMRVYANPDASQAEMIASAEEMATLAFELASASAATFEDLDHPGYEMDFNSANKAYEKGYAYWADYMAMAFIDRIQIGYTEAESWV